MLYGQLCLYQSMPFPTAFLSEYSIYDSQIYPFFSKVNGAKKKIESDGSFDLIFTKSIYLPSNINCQLDNRCVWAVDAKFVGQKIGIPSFHNSCVQLSYAMAGVRIVMDVLKVTSPQKTHYGIIYVCSVLQWPINILDTINTSAGGTVVCQRLI